MVVDRKFDEFPESISENIPSKDELKNFRAADPEDLLADFDTED